MIISIKSGQEKKMTWQKFDTWNSYHCCLFHASFCTVPSWVLLQLIVLFTEVVALATGKCFLASVWKYDMLHTLWSENHHDKWSTVVKALESLGLTLLSGHKGGWVKDGKISISMPIIFWHRSQWGHDSEIITKDENHFLLAIILGSHLPLASWSHQCRKEGDCTEKGFNPGPGD